MIGLGSLILAAKLCGAITGREVPAPIACSASLAIVATADGWPVETIAALAFSESRYNASKVNVRSGACGPMQTLYRPLSAHRRRCRAILADAWLGYAAGVEKLRGASAFCARLGDRSTLCMLAGYASGPAGVRGHWYVAPRKVLAHAEAIRLRMGLRPGGDV